jgi:hypothetical protein
MTSKYCGLCRRRHYVQAVPEYDTPRRETTRDVAVGLISWVLILAAYYAAIAWVWANHV